MKRATRMHKAAWLVLTLPLIAVALTFQNCSKVDFKATTNPSVAGTGEKVAMYANMTVGQANVPPLKLIFVVDNSYTMQANQISLSSAFGSLFTGQNATNLSPFESTAYIFTTSQASIAPSSPSFGLLPSVSYDQMKSMSFSDLSLMRGSASAQVDGKFAGDIVSYSVSNLPDPVTLLNSWSYIPTPVLGLTATGASAPVELGVHKEKSGSVGDFAAAFSDRISYISPLRSKYDSAGHGLLDPVTDHESGLCALARVLKNNSGFLQKGDLAAFVIVSDEDDNDPSGSSCVDAYKEYKDADLIDAHCETPTTDIAYNAKNTVAPTCRLNYQTGFTYTAKYDAPITKFAFDDAYHKYQSAQATVTYATASYTYDRYKYVAHSYKKSPTYAVPQVQVSWYTKSTACKERDGVKFDCVDSFTQRSAQVNGTYNGSNCSTLSSSVASNAVKNDASHPIACAQGTPSPRSGACDPNDKTIVDCQQNYSKLGDVALYSDSNQAKCSDLIVGRLPSGAIDSGEPSAYLPTCEQPVAVRTNSNGFCTSAKANCVANAPVTGLKKTVSQAYTGSNCPTLIAAANLPSNAITSAGDPRSPTCANTPVWDSKATAGACPTALPSGKVACENSRQPHSGGATASGQPASGQSCQDFAETSHTLPSNAILSSVTCTAATTPSNASRVVTYDSSYPNLVVKAGDACPSSILADVKSSYGSSATCTIASVSQPTKTYQGTCADNAGAIAILC